MQILQLAKEPVTDRYLVRVMEAQYVDRNGLKGEGRLGGPLAGAEGIKYWTTSFAHTEGADLDPRLLMKKSGVDPDPDAEYVACLIDREKAEAFMKSESFVPSFENMQAFVAGTLPKDFDPELTEQVLSDEYQPTYACLHDMAFEPGKVVNLDKPAEVEKFARAHGLDLQAQEQLQQRRKLHQCLGANQHNTGNGLTLNNISEPAKIYGNVETFTYDAEPKAFNQMLAAGVVDIIGPDEVQPIPGVRA